MLSLSVCVYVIPLVIDRFFYSLASTKWRRRRGLGGKCGSGALATTKKSSPVAPSQNRRKEMEMFSSPPPGNGVPVGQ